LQHNLRTFVRAAIDLVQQQPHGLSAELVAGHTAGSQGGDDQGSQQNVVKANDGQVIRYLAAQISAGLQRADGNQVVVTKESGQFRVNGQQMTSGFSAAFYYGGTMSRPVRIVGQGSSGQGSAVAFSPLATTVGGQGASEEAHRSVTGLQ
jgi:hypothetical protein